ncbi:MAG: hypothetical protein JNJ99_04275, partial [Crocinitomicaceae bacterium]|nr:hypothetical protein [Crocinitomicaceae bacterium]
MNKKLILLGSLSVVAVSAITVLNSTSPDGVYTPRFSAEKNQTGIDGAFDLYHMLKGDFSKEDWIRAQNQALNMPADRAVAFNWLDQGPDNVGGRTRAILVDKDNINHVYAGSVSGGLFESFNRANEWNRVEEFQENLGVSAMCQTPDGTLYVAT